MKTAFVPNAGDFVWLTFDPQAGREQAGRRPALVLSPKMYNPKSGRDSTGVLLADHLNSVDWKGRHAEGFEHCTDEVVQEARARLAPLLGF